MGRQDLQLNALDLAPVRFSNAALAFAAPVFQGLGDHDPQTRKEDLEDQEVEEPHAAAAQNDRDRII